MTAARIRLGMVGGGYGAFIGAAHRIAARLDDRYVFAAGALSSDPETARASAAELGLDPGRTYSDYAEMARAEAMREDGVDVVSVVTPNHLHHAVCKAFLENGIDVICDKPLTTTLSDARDLLSLSRRHDRLLGVTYTYTGYPMVREARALIADGTLGRIRLVQVEFAIGWLSTPVERDGESKQAEWRTDPDRAGPSFVVADLGTHCFHLAEFTTGEQVSAVSADISTFVEGRKLEDNANLNLRFCNGARGQMWVSMVAAGETVGLRLRVYGERGHIAWHQHRPDELHLALTEAGQRMLVRGEPGLSEAARRSTRIVAGLPEGYYEAFANLYRDYADLIEARQNGKPPDPLAMWAPQASEGVRGIEFVDSVLRSATRDGAWTTLPGDE